MNFFINLIQDQEGGAKCTRTSFSPVTSRDKGISSQNFMI